MIAMRVDNSIFLFTVWSWPILRIFLAQENRSVVERVQERRSKGGELRGRNF